ncbi:hypothetical protein AB835_10410 [Candidatus Endobugula sertula]|uniref:Polysaccharide biosynthesis protein n=1 Tax=Candidatus Endobugula sertula TaxID=62101 RepID=A0A1D2QNI3_9GAMM|nr:hypothetical protein AB835_10410 [Candidatus Endobugula sertula]
MNLLKSKKVVSALWVFGGYGAAQVIRLASNLILTRLLAPEMFGLMVLVSAILIGVTLLSDVGIRDSIINTKGESQSRFLNTAWTLQVCRGMLIFLCIFFAAPPLEAYFQYEGLALLLQVCALISVFNGCASLNMYVLEKQLEFRVQVCIETGVNILCAGLMIVAALFYQSVWCLAIGMLAQAFLKMVWTHTLLPGQKMRFDFELASVKKITHFGKWIFLSTAAMYATFQGDKLILAKIITPYELGIYSIAAIFGYVLKDVIANVSNKMIMPIYRQVVENGEPLRKILKARFTLLLLAFLMSLLISGFGETVIRVLYDDRYAGAGWILQLLVFAGLCHSFDDTIRSFLMANRDSFHGFCVQGLKGVIFLSMAFWLSSSFGIIGMLVAMALTPLLVFPYLMYVVSLHGYRWCYMDFISLFIVVVSFSLLWRIQNGELWGNLMTLLTLGA